MTWAIGIIVVFLAVLAIGVVLRLKSSPKLSGASQRKLQAAWQHARSLQDPHRKILECDKVLDLLLSELGYQGSLGDKLRKAGKYIPSVQDVWNAHKLRNRIAHEPGTQVSAQEALGASRAFEAVIAKYVSL